MITITVTCAMCGARSTERDDIKCGALSPEALSKWLEAEGWVVQINGDNIDTYCSKACAK